MPPGTFSAPRVKARGHVAAIMDVQSVLRECRAGPGRVPDPRDHRGARAFPQQVRSKIRIPHSCEETPGLGSSRVDSRELRWLCSGPLCLPATRPSRPFDQHSSTCCKDLIAAKFPAGKRQGGPCKSEFLTHVCWEVVFLFQV